MLKILIVTHRWLGVALCTLFLLWYPSGIGMMYWGMPAITARDRLERAPALDPSRIALSLPEAAERAWSEPAPNQVRLTTFDGRPAYRFGSDARDGSGGEVVFADTGELHEIAGPDMRARAVAAWTGQAASAAAVASVTEPDQWTVGNRLRAISPLWKYSWPNGEDVYIDESGDVLLHTTTASRLAAYASAVPHWLYFTPLRDNQPFWIRFAAYSAMIGTAGALLGVLIGAWMYSPGRRYRFTGGVTSRVPFRGQKRLHTILGLIFGVATVTWTFSGALAFLPFPQPQRAPAPAQTSLSLTPQRGRQSANQSLAAALRGQPRLEDFATLDPRMLLTMYPDAREMQLTSFDGEPLVAIRNAEGATRLATLDGRQIDEIDRGRIIDIVRSVAADAEAVEIRQLDQYDRYYLDRTRQQPLPVVLALMNDEAHTRYYIDPKTASIVGTFSDRNFWRRWLYNGLHSLNFPWLYNYRPLWDIVVITFMLGGTALCVTSLVLAWRAVGKRLALATARYSTASNATVELARR